MSNFDGIYKPQSPHSPENPPPQQRISLLGTKKRRRWPLLVLAVFILAVLGSGILIFTKAARVANKIFVGQQKNFFGKLSGLVSGGQQTLATDKNQTVNILLLGIGGEGHDGPYLSDTMILAQVNPSRQQISLVSIPRDYLAEMPDGSQQKINAAFSLGFTKRKDWDEAGSWARQTVEKISGTSIPYFAVIDFSGFEKAVNEVGGLDIHIDRTFTDYSYPDSGTGYLPPQTFTEGSEHMNGSRSLIFARSRHAAGIEGSDFARSQRQQKIISAFKQKVLNMNIISDASQINKLLNIFADHFHTNLTPAQLNELYQDAKDKDGQGIASVSLDPETRLICPEILESNGAYVLTPCPGKSEYDIQNFFSSSFSLGKLSAESSRVWLANSTDDSRKYKTAYRRLTDAGMTVMQLPYSKDDLPQTLIYEVVPKPATASFIHDRLQATSVTLPPPQVKIPEDKVDVIVILGENAPSEPDPVPYMAPPAKKPTSTTSTLDSIQYILPTSTPATTSPEHSLTGA